MAGTCTLPMRPEPETAHTVHVSNKGGPSPSNRRGEQAGPETPRRTTGRGSLGSSDETSPKWPELGSAAQSSPPAGKAKAKGVWSAGISLAVAKNDRQVREGAGWCRGGTVTALASSSSQESRPAPSTEPPPLHVSVGVLRHGCSVHTVCTGCVPTGAAVWHTCAECMCICVHTPVQGVHKAAGTSEGP